MILNFNLDADVAQRVGLVNESDMVSAYATRYEKRLKGL